MLRAHGTDQQQQTNKKNGQDIEDEGAGGEKPCILKEKDRGGTHKKSADTLFGERESSVCVCVCKWKVSHFLKGIINLWKCIE